MGGFFHDLRNLLSSTRENTNSRTHEINTADPRHLAVSQDLGASQRSYIPRQNPLGSAQAYTEAFVPADQPAYSDQSQHNSSGTLSFAHDFTINNPVIAENIHLSEPSLALKWLEVRALPGVEYHSEARDPPPRCHVGTREKFITTTERPLSDPNTEMRLLFLYGPAGVGKSAIIQTLAERQEEGRPLLKGATLFFPSLTLGNLSDSSPDNSARVWLTISYRLATLDPSYLAYVITQIRRDPKILEANMKQQFKTLIAEPLGEKKLLKSSGLLPIFIDGLDQCRKYEMMLQIIANFISDYPSAPLLWIITGRPDRRLLKAFDKLPLQDRVKKDFIPVDSEDALADVKIFLRSKFDQFQEDWDIINPSPWPKVDDFNHILASARGFFKIASAIARFVGSPDVDDPMAQLKVVVSTVAPLPTSAPEHTNPFLSVHEMYSEILQNVSEDHYRTAKRILGFYLLPRGFGSWASQSTSFLTLCNILDIEQGVASASLSRLLPLLDIPKPKDAIDTPIRFFHASFAEFLISPEASKKFWIDMQEVVDDLWQCHSRILRQANLSADTPLPRPNEIKLAWSPYPEEAQQYRIKLWRNAQRVFFHQLLPCPAAHCAMGIHYDELSVRGSTRRIGVLREINFDNLVDRYTLPDVPYRLLAFLDWLIESDDDLIRHGLLKMLDLGVRGFGWLKQDGISFRVDVERSHEGGSLITFKTYTDSALNVPAGVPSEGLFSTREPPATSGQLLNDLALHKDGFSASVVVGTRATGQCALLVDKNLENLTIYYLLPYDPTA